MAQTMDHLTSATLKHLRESWWDDEFTGFLEETLRPRAGNRILDVGCADGIGEISIARLRISQLHLFGVDVDVPKVIAARKQVASHNIRAGFAAGDASSLPFKDASFDSTYCVAVLQHIKDVDAAVKDFARVTRGGGRIVCVEPDNAARYFYSASSFGRRASQVAAQFFGTLAAARGDGTDQSIGPKLPGLFVKYGVEPIDVRVFPVSQIKRGVLTDTAWQERRARVEQAVAQAATEDVKTLGREYLVLFDAYVSEAKQAGPSFVEIQNTMLIATVGQKN